MKRAIESGVATVLASALVWCSPRRLPSGPDPATVHRSCLNACDNVRRLPACTRGARSKPASALSKVLSAASEYDGKRVRIRAQLEEGGHYSTLMDCDPGECCNSMIDPFVSLIDVDSRVHVELTGTLRLESGAQKPLRCQSRDGYTLKTYVTWDDQRTLTYGLWDRERRGEPPAGELVSAHCCSVDVRGQSVLAEGTLEIAKRPFESHRLLDPLLCEMR